MKLSENLKKIRKDNSLSQEQFAEKLGVSRQAVSKWESNQSYPEMDKVLLICKMFNYNIDTLLNNNIVDVKEQEQAKINVNKYVEDFFDFITKTTNMFYNMKFFQIVKCLFEQFINCIFLLFICVIIGAIGDAIFSGIFAFLPNKVFYGLKSIVEGIYIALAAVVSVIVFLHIFKIRYLDYFEIMEERDNEKEDSNGDNKEENKETKKLEIEKVERINSKKEKIIFRDPNHNPFGFLEIITKLVIIGLKALTLLFVVFPASVALVASVAAIILFFTITKSGLLFIGLELGSISAIIFIVIILIFAYNFIVSKKTRLRQLGIAFLVCCVLCGMSIAFSVLGVSKFNKEDETLENNVEISENFLMSDKLTILNRTGQINYIAQEDMDNNIKIVVKHSERYNVYLDSFQDKIKITEYNNQREFIEYFKNFTDMINNKKIIHYKSGSEIDVYASQSNIDKLKNNNKKVSYKI